MIPPPAPDAGKDAFREWARQARRDVDWDSVSARIVAHLAEWPPFVEAGVVLTFLPLPAEVDLDPLRLAPGSRLMAATHTPERGGDLTIHELSGPLEVHRFGFLQPHAGAPRLEAQQVDIFLVPGLAFDLWGARLGRGAGYFDRLLTGVRPHATLAGIAPAALVVDRLPAEPSDVPVGYLATEEGIVAVAR